MSYNTLNERTNENQTKLFTNQGALSQILLKRVFGDRYAITQHDEPKPDINGETTNATPPSNETINKTIT